MELSYRLSGIILIAVVGLVAVSAVVHPIATIQAALYNGDVPSSAVPEAMNETYEQDLFEGSVPSETPRQDYRMTASTKMWFTDKQITTNYEIRWENQSRFKWIAHDVTGNLSWTVKGYHYGDPKMQYFVGYANRTGEGNDIVRRGLVDSAYATRGNVLNFPYGDYVNLSVVNSRHVDGLGTVYRFKVTESMQLYKDATATYATGYVDIQEDGEIVSAQLTLVAVIEGKVVTHRAEVSREEVTVTEPARFGEYAMNATYVDTNTMKVTNTGEKPWKSWILFWDSDRHGTPKDRTIRPGETVYLNKHVRYENGSWKEIDVVVSKQDYDPPANVTRKFFVDDYLDDGRLDGYDVQYEDVQIIPENGWDVEDNVGVAPCKEIPVENYSIDPYCPVHPQDSHPSIYEKIFGPDNSSE